MLEEIKSAARKAGDARRLRGLVDECRQLLSARGEANSVALARELVDRFEALPDPLRGRFFAQLASEFSPDPKQVLAAAQAYSRSPGAGNLLQLMRVAEPPRQELLRRINRTPGGTASIVAMRRSLLDALPAQPELAGVEADFLHLLSSWFNPGFLELVRVDWNSPAQLLEKLIRHEAVHQIDGWDDLRRRLQPDRRCFAFFHPQLPNEPLIFVEVALVPEMPAAIAPLIDKRSTPLEAAQFKVAAFYSISNCEPGLKSVSLGNFLIKRVAEELKRELPQLKTFCTLSPIPGFARWLRAGAASEGITGARAARLAQAQASWLEAPDSEAGRQALLRLGAVYLGLNSARPGGDPVARFHLDNGARLERLNPSADLSSKGVAQSLGLMVNYLYDLDRIETHHEQFIRGVVAHSRAVAALL
ncbi:MAG: malonyl-CoA decarboxylase [Burkholderiaceae bacterium]